MTDQTRERKLTKPQAIAEVKARGYTVEEGEGESGDEGYGSRLYFSMPDSPRNSFGVALNNATVSKVPGFGWLTSYFGDAAPKAIPAVTAPPAYIAVLKTFLSEKCESFGGLYSRWLDEREYEDFAEYAEVMKKLVPAELEFVKATKKPFGFQVRPVGETAIFQFKVTTREVSFAPVRA